VKYTLEVTNLGLSDAHDVLITDYLPAGLSFEAGGSAAQMALLAPALNQGAGVVAPDLPTMSCTLQSSDPDVVACNVGDLLVGESQTFELYARVDADAVPGVSLLNVAVISHSGVDPVATNNRDDATIFVRGLADLKITKFGKPDGEAFAGQTILYTVIVDNFGPGYAHNVVVNDTVVTNGEFTVTLISSDRPATCLPVVPADAALTFTFTCQLTDPLEPALNGGSGRWTILMTLVANEPQSINNTARVSSTDFDPNLANNYAIAQHQVTERADLEIVKTAIGQNQVLGQAPGIYEELPDKVTAGMILTYTLTITNHGPSTSRNVVLQDLQPGAVELKAILPRQGV
jgi:uncharacterized repeat protein (TIGR01451 family)